MKKQENKRLLSVKETAEMLGMSPRTIYNMVGRKAKRKFPVRPKRIGRLIRFDLQDLTRFIDSL